MFGWGLFLLITGILGNIDFMVTHWGWVPAEGGETAQGIRALIILFLQGIGCYLLQRAWNKAHLKKDASK